VLTLVTMTQKAQDEVQHWTDRSRQRAVTAAVVLVGNSVLLGYQQWHDPGARWLAYWWLVTVTLDGAGLWLWRTEQKRYAWGDKAAAWWCWHWFTGAKLVLVNNRELRWWLDVWRCFPWLDTDRAAACTEVPELENDAGLDVPLSPEVQAHMAQLADDARRERRRCLVRRAVTGAGRTLLTAGLILAEYLRSGAPQGAAPSTLAIWGFGGALALAVYAVALAAVTIWLAMRKWWVWPLAIALASLADWPHSKRAGSWVKVSRRWEDGRRLSWLRGPRRLFEVQERGVEIVLNGTYKAGNKHTLDEPLLQTYAKSGLSPLAVEPVWDLVGANRSLRLVPAVQIPEKVSFADDQVRETWEQKGTRWTGVFGAGKGWKWVTRSIKTEPHVLITGPTGSGKSEMVHNVLAGFLWHNRKAKGTRAEIWDVKVKSHVAFERLRCVDYYRRLSDIGLRCLAVAQEARDRGTKSARAELAGQPVEFPPLFVVFEDTAQAVQKMHAMRKLPLFGGLPDLGTFEDALLAWDEILGLGRGVNIHAIAAPHRPEVKALGGGIVRVNFGLVFLLTGHDHGALRMVDPSLKWEPLAAIPGRAILLHGQSRIELQGIWDEHGDMIQLLADHYGLRDLPADYDVMRGTGGQHGLPPLPQVDDREGHHHDHGPQHSGHVHGVGDLTEPEEHDTGNHQRLPGGGSTGGVGGRPMTPTPRGGAHADILTGVSMATQAATPGGEGRRDRKSVRPEGSAHVVRQPAEGLPVAPSHHARATSPEGPGVMGPDAAASTTTASSPPQAPWPTTPPWPESPENPPPVQPHPQSLPRSGVPAGAAGVVPGGRGGTREDGPGDGGPAEVTLSEAWESGLVGQGVTLGAVQRARTRSREVVAQFVERALAEGRTHQDGEDDALAEGWWFPPIVGTRPARGGQVEEEYATMLLPRWWNSRQRAAPDDGEWWVYWLVEGGLGGVRFGATVKIGFTDDLRRRCRELGRHYPGHDGVGGDIVHLERCTSKAAAQRRERQLHRVYKRCHRRVNLDTDPPVHPGTSLMCWPRGGGGKGGRETFWIEDVLAEDMARHCPRRRTELYPPEAVTA